MILNDAMSAAVREALAEHRRFAEQAERAPTVDVALACLARCWGARLKAYDLLNSSEAAARGEALAKLERVA